MHALKLSLGWALALLSASAFGQDASSKAHLDFFKSKIQPVLTAHCYGCHSSEAKKPKGDFRMDTLAPDFADARSRESWLEVVKRVKAGEMPPKTKPRPTEKE